MYTTKLLCAISSKLIIFRLNQLDEAVICFNESIIRNPRDVHSYTNLSYTYNLLGEYCLTIRLCESAEEVIDTQSMAYYDFL